MVIRQDLDANGDLVVDNGPFPGLLTIHDAADFALVAEVPLPRDLVYMRFSADGSFLAALDIKGDLRLFDMADLRSGAGADAVFATATIGLYEFGITPDDKVIINSADGALTARLVDEDLRVAWTIETGTGPIGPIGPIGFDGGYVWTVVDERLGQGQGDSFGLVGFPLDRDELVAYAKSKLSRELSESECQRYLALDSCADRLAS